MKPIFCCYGSWKRGVLFGNKDLRTVSNDLVFHIDFVYVACSAEKRILLILLMKMAMLWYLGLSGDKDFRTVQGQRHLH